MPSNAHQALPNSESDFGVKASKSEIAARLRSIIKNAGGSTAASEKTGINLRTLNNYLSGISEPKVSALALLSRATGVSLDWLATGEGEMLQQINKGGAVATTRPSTLMSPGDDDYIYLPRYEVRAAAGAGQVVHSEQIVDYLAFRAEWVRRTLRRRPEDICVIEAHGDSMEPTISNGDLLIVDMSIGQICDGAIYVFSYRGVLLVKRIAPKLTGELVISSDNPRYPSDTLTRDQIIDLNVIGHVVWHGGLV
jgi:phage repressor protein C with HTH and peptisase S24 domain